MTHKLDPTKPDQKWPSTVSFERKQLRKFELKLAKAEPTHIIAEIHYLNASGKTSWFAVYEHDTATGFTWFKPPWPLKEEQLHKLLYFTRTRLTDPLNLPL